MTLTPAQIADVVRIAEAAARKVEAEVALQIVEQAAAGLATKAAESAAKAARMAIEIRLAQVAGGQR